MKEFKKTTVFFVIAILFWCILTLIAFQKNYTTQNFQGKEFLTVKGEIISCEQWEDNVFFYIRIDTCPKVQFRITYEEGISLKKLEELQLNKEEITFMVSEEDYLMNKEIGDVEVLSLSCDGKVFWDLNQYYEEQQKGYKIQMVICIVMTTGMLCSYIYLRKQFIISKRKNSSIYKHFKT